MTNEKNRDDINSRELPIVSTGLGESVDDSAEHLESSWRVEFDRSEKRMLLATGVFLLSLLVVARFLTPSKTGIGTHQGLGLPACQFRTIFGVDCPSCGMTTSWAHLTRLDIVSSLQANPGGMLLGVFSFVMAVWMLLSVWKGSWWPIWCQTKWVLGSGLGIIAVTLIHWVWKITA